METVRLGFLLVALNELQVCVGDIVNAYLYGKTREKVYVIAGPEFGEHSGKRLIIDKALYGLKSSAAIFHEHLSVKLKNMCYKPSKADPGLWMKDCGTHYEYIDRYVDDIISWSKDPLKVINELKSQYILKGVGIPEYYLGGNVEVLCDQWHTENIQFALSAQNYIENVVK